MFFSPFVTRLYGPEAFGLQGLFVSVVNLLAIVAALGYPTAIVLPNNDSDALRLVRLSLYIGIGTSLLAAIVLHFFGQDLLRLLNAESITEFLVLIPFAMIVSVFGNTLSQWLNRKKAFQFTARFTIITSLLVNIGKTGMGCLYPTALVLIATNLAGSLFGSTLAYFGWRKSMPQHPTQKNRCTTTASLSVLAIRHADFPLLRTPQNLINAISQSLPVLLLATYFGASEAGLYSIVIAVLGIPTNLLGNSVMAVFYPLISEAIHDGKRVRGLIVKATIGMAMTGSLPFLFVAVTGPFLFGFVFGKEWQAAGVYAQWLSLWLFFQYINKPAVSAIPALRLQGGLLIYELFSTGTKILALWLGFSFYKNALMSIALFSIFGVVAYIWLIIWVVLRSDKLEQRKHA